MQEPNHLNSPISPNPLPSDLNVAELFPHLSEEMVDRMRRFGHEESFAPGESLFESGARDVDLFVGLSGELEMYGLGETGEQVLLTQSAGQFSGEMNLFSDVQTYISMRAKTDCRVLRIKLPDLRRLIREEAEIGGLLLHTFIHRRLAKIAHGYGAVVLVGSTHSTDTLRIQSFLARNLSPYRLLDTDLDEEANTLLAGFQITPEQLPVIITPDQKVLRNPRNAELAEALGFMGHPEPDTVYDVAVVGAGPGGLAAAVYAASEGLSTIVIESIAPGGQAGSSSRIENYLGFPLGISGLELAGRAQTQAQKFGAKLLVSRPAKSLVCGGEHFLVELEDEHVVKARSVVVATGARYRKLSVAGYERFEGQGIYYAATAVEAKMCSKEEAVVVGAGNSAGQAAMFLSRSCRCVHLLVRGPSLAATMSDYLVQRILTSPSVKLHVNTEITELEGETLLQTVTWEDRVTGERERREVGRVFVMIGAQPNTGWLCGSVQLDSEGFVCTSQKLVGPGSSQYETSVPGVYAIGDVRAGSVKRVASSVGEGSVVVQAVHGFLSRGE